MRRFRLATACIAALALGLLSSVVVAWSLALALGEQTTSPNRPIGLQKPDALLSLNEGAALGKRFRMISYVDSLGRKLTEAELAQKRIDWAQRPESATRHTWPDSWLTWGDLERPAEWLVRRRQSAFGFPLVCLWYERSGGLSMFGGAASLHGGYDVTKALGRQRTGFVAEAALPWRSIWVGLVGNTLLYALAWFGLMALLARWRRRRAHRRGICHVCRYDLSGVPADAPCPECGNVPRRGHPSAPAVTTTPDARR